MTTGGFGQSSINLAALGSAVGSELQILPINWATLLPPELTTSGGPYVIANFSDIDNDSPDPIDVVLLGLNVESQVNVFILNAPTQTLTLPLPEATAPEVSFYDDIQQTISFQISVQSNPVISPTLVTTVFVQNVNSGQTVPVGNVFYGRAP